MATKKLDINSLLKKYDLKGSKSLINAAYRQAMNKAKEVKKEAMDEFKKHPVTQEVKKGPVGNSSPLLGGSGNFFGFLGFEKESEPIKILTQALDSSFMVNKQSAKILKVQKTTFTIEFDIQVPTTTEIYSITPLPWTTKSWVQGVEKGITNYTKTVFRPRKGVGFLYEQNSRSGVALQTKRDVNFIRFTPTPYITEILKKAVNKLK
tara:strand:- start:223 stop:843 length:621 start_codon:yes stop_codon:yes gene_type:complete